MTMSVYNDPRFNGQPVQQPPRRGQATLKKVAVIAAAVAVVAAVLAAVSALLVPNPCTSLERRTDAAYQEYAAYSDRLRAQQARGTLTEAERVQRSNESPLADRWLELKGDRDRCMGKFRDKRTTVMTVPAAVSGLALMVAFYATFALVLRSRQAAKAARVAASAATQAARAAQEAHQQRRAQRAHAAQAQGAGAGAGAGAGYGTGYNDADVIDAEVVDFPYESDEYPATGQPQPEAPREEPTMSKPASGWGSSFTFEEE